MYIYSQKEAHVKKIIPVLREDDEDDYYCTDGYEQSSYHDNRDGNGQGLVRSQSTPSICCDTCCV